MLQLKQVKWAQELNEQLVITPNIGYGLEKEARGVVEVTLVVH